MRKVSLIGSTGSIGRQALEVAEEGLYSVCALAAGKNVRLTEEQARKFNPAIAYLFDEKAAGELRNKLKDTDVRVVTGESGLYEVICEGDMVLNAATGIAGLRPTLAAIKQKKPLALANKESLVTAGHIVMAEAKKNQVDILPVDSEHSAVFQCLAAGRKNEVEKIILTASGGPFFGWTKERLQTVTADQALNHPNWRMGPRITVDSATMMNKGFEIIEASWLFNKPTEQVDVLVHRQSMVHSMVMFNDGSIIAQIAPPDMKMPIRHVISWPERTALSASRLDLSQAGVLTFSKADEAVFPAMQLCRKAMAEGGNRGAVINGADEAAVSMFLSGKIGFLDIYRLVEQAYEQVPNIAEPDLDQIMESDLMARAYVNHQVR